MKASGNNKIIFKDTRTERAIEEEKERNSAIRIAEEAKKKQVEFLEKQSEKVDINLNQSIDNFRYKTSYIEDYEEEEAKRLIEESLGFERPRITGYHMAVKIYVRPEDIYEFTKEDGSKGKFYLPSSATAHDKWTNCVGLVLSQGSDCYQKSRFTHAWCKVGDWIIIPRNEGTQLNYRGIPMQILPDDRCLGVVSDPTWVTRD